MSSRRVYFMMIGLICLLAIGLIAGAYGTNKVLGAQAINLTNLKARSKALDKEQQGLTIAKKQIAANADLNKIVSSIVPQDKDQAEAVREIVSIAEKSGIVLGSITFPASSLGSGAVAPTAAGAAPAKPFSSSGSSKTSGLSQLQPVKNIPGVYDLQIMVQGDAKVPVPYSQLITFLSSLEHNRRTAQVSTIAIQPDDKNPKLITFSLTLDEYIKP
jgi:hypothetical protein